MFENQEDGDEMGSKVNLVKNSKREAAETLETVHCDFVMTSIGDQNIFD